MTTTEWLTRLAELNWRQSGHLVIDEVDLDPNQLVAQILTVGIRIVPSHDGPISLVREYGVADDYSKQTGFFDYHVDGLYLPSPPQLVMLWCAHPGRGDTPTLFADGHTVWRNLEQRGFAPLMQKLEVTYIGRGGQLFTRPLVLRHPRTAEPTIALGSRAFLRQAVLEGDIRGLPTLRDITEFSHSLMAEIDSNVVREHYWAPGQLVLFDNFRFLHARKAAALDDQRELLRVWLEGPVASTSNPQTAKSIAV